jgi:transcriptional regulator with XRE-family HTH domain
MPAETKPFLVLFRERVRQLRESLKISVSDAALALEVHRTVIWRFESGAQPIPIAVLPKMAKLYGVDVADLCSFPSVATRYELFEGTRNLPEESLQQLLREARRLGKAAKSSAPPADPKVAWQHVHAKLGSAPAQEKTTRKKVV